MKRLVIIILVLVPFIVGCGNDEQSNSELTKVREVAWNYLGKAGQQTVITPWREAVVVETTYEEVPVYAVSFNTTEDAILGPIVVFVRKSNLSVLAAGLRN